MRCMLGETLIGTARKNKGAIRKAARFGWLQGLASGQENSAVGPEVRLAEATSMSA